MNRKLSVLSVSFLERVCANVKFKGPIGVNQSTPIPADDLKWFESPIALE